jgi:CHASE1-domain containing sensor protein
MFTGNNQQSHDVVGGVHNRLRLHVPWLILSFGIVLSIVAYFLVRNWEEAMISADFNMFAATHAAAIHREAIRHFDASTSIVGLYDASKEVDRREFRQFSKEILTHHADVQAVMWVPRVSKANSDKLRKEAVQDGLTNFHIHEPN